MMTEQQRERVLSILNDAIGEFNFSHGYDEPADTFWVGIPSSGEHFMTVTSEWAAGLLTRNRGDAVALAKVQIDLADQRSGETKLVGANRKGAAPHIGHYKETCKCGAVLKQCRCPGPKAEHVVADVCPACETETKAADISKEPLPVETERDFYKSQLNLLGDFLMCHYPREIGRGFPDGTNAGNEAAIEVAMRLLTPGGPNPAKVAPYGRSDWSPCGLDTDGDGDCGNPQCVCRNRETPKQTGTRIIQNIQINREPDPAWVPLVARGVEEGLRRGRSGR